MQLLPEKQQNYHKQGQCQDLVSLLTYTVSLGLLLPHPSATGNLLKHTCGNFGLLNLCLKCPNSSLTCRKFIPIRSLFSVFLGKSVQVSSFRNPVQNMPELKSFPPPHEN